ncbi:uncharacterized protein LAESUDRAFT_94523 [Laetiporus sulphureus 93-53]|uniref:Uncharacterized protein n=1 Tax=Laetiporus sulphureus 93-53 TaxID=1314785 RepID=A0A165AU23_9APHY|nr:uncharacterized protein LAESUDRAFT_94523 [Laetiporus sulphureus 93-53]KZS99661.1 hypothetical protein LAESUDRAFT_94523 [Laetiporus sulphureus 93-53]
MRPALSTRTPLLDRCSIHGLKILQVARTCLYTRRRERKPDDQSFCALTVRDGAKPGQEMRSGLLMHTPHNYRKQIGQQQRDMSGTHRTWPR